MKPLLVIGGEGRTVVGKARVKKDLISIAGQYPEMGRKAVKLIPDAISPLVRPPAIRIDARRAEPVFF